MTTIITRAGKGSPLTNNEMDTNLINLNTAKLENTNTNTGSTPVAVGTTAQRDGTPAAGYLRFNSDSTQFEGYNGISWTLVGGATVSNDTSTATNLYPLFANATTGSATTIYTSNAKYLYKPSTGELQSTTFNANNGIFTNANVINADQTIVAATNGGSFGPISVASGVTVTVESGAVWSIV